MAHGDQKFNIKTSHFFIILSILILIGGIVIFYYAQSIIFPQKTSPQTPATTQSNLNNQDNLSQDPLITILSSEEEKLTAPVITSTDPVKGSSEAKVTIVEFSDFGCFYCALVQDNLKELEQIYGSQIRFVWKDFPQIKEDSQSFKAHEAARCAQDQGKFWEMHDKIFANQLNLSLDLYSDLAPELDLNLDKFNNCLKSGQKTEIVQVDILEGLDLGIEALPYFYIGDQEISGAATLDYFQQVIDQELSK